MDRQTYDDIIELLHREVKPALGCTEPVAVSLAVAKACSLFPGQVPQRIVVEVSANIPGSSVHGIFQARVLEWVVIAFSDQLARKRHLMWNQSPKQEVEEKKKRHKFRVKTDLNPNASSSTL